MPGGEGQAPEFLCKLLGITGQIGDIAARSNGDLVVRVKRLPQGLLLMLDLLRWLSALLSVCARAVG